MSGVSFRVEADTSQTDRKLDNIIKTLSQIKGSSNIKVAANTAGTEAKLQEINKSLRNINTSAQSVSSSISNAFRGIGAAIGITAIGASLKAASDNAILLENRMKTITKDTTLVAAAMRTVRDLSLETRTAVDATATLYQKYSRAAEELGASSEEILNVTRLTAQAIKLSGTNADSANAAVIQLGQGLSSGVLRGEELNSVLEQAPRLARAIAEGMGTSIGQLRKLGAEGALTSEKVFSALSSQADKLGEEFGRMTATMSDQLTNLSTASSYFVSEFMKGLSTGGIGRMFETLTTNIYASAETIQTKVAGIVSKVKLEFYEVKGVVSAIVNVAGALYRNIAQALPVLTTVRTLFGDIYGVASGAISKLGAVLRKPFIDMMNASREAEIYVTSFFGLFDFEIARAMRAAFRSDNLLEFKQAMNDLADGIDGNTDFILNRLARIPREIKYFVQDIGSYFGILEKPRVRLGYFEPLFNSLSELKEGFIDNVKWSAKLNSSMAAFSDVGKVVFSILNNLSVILGAVAVAFAGIASSLLSVFDRLTSYLADAAREFRENNTFKDIFEASKEYLNKALDYFVDFGKRVIEVFFDIWDAVIGHSWWTDTIDSIVNTSNSLWDKASSGLNRFAKNTKSLFRDIYDNRPSTNILDSLAENTTATIDRIRIKVGKIDFPELFDKIKAVFVETFERLKDNYKDILETAGIAILFMGIVSLFPGTVIAQAISAKALVAITAGLAIVSDRLIGQITGGSPLGAIAVTMGEVLGRELYRFITNIPQILNAALGTITGFMRGFASQIPYIGRIFEGIMNIDGVGNVLGLLGSVIFGRSVLTVLNAFGLVKTSVKDVTQWLHRLVNVFGTRGLMGAQRGLLMKALFGPSEMAVVGLLLLVNGAFDELLNNSTLAKWIAAGGLFALLFRGFQLRQIGTVLNGVITGAQQVTLALSKTFAFLGLQKLNNILGFTAAMQIMFSVVKQYAAKMVGAIANAGWGTTFQLIAFYFKNAFKSMSSTFSNLGFSTALQLLWFTVKSSWSSFLVWFKSASILNLPAAIASAGGQIITAFVFLISSLKTKWAGFSAWMSTNIAATTWGATLASQFNKVTAAIVTMRVALTALAASPIGKLLLNKWVLGAAAVGGSMLLAGEAGATTTGTQTTNNESEEGLFSRLYEKLKIFLSENVVELMMGGSLAYSIGPAIVGFISSSLGSLTTILGTLGVTFSQVIIAGIGSAFAVLTSPITLTIAGILGAGYLLLDAFGEGEDFMEKLGNFGVYLGRTVGLFKKEEDPENKKILMGGFSEKAESFIKANNLPGPDNVNLDNIYTDMISAGSMKNYEQSKQAYINALEKGVKAVTSGVGVDQETWKEIQKQGDGLTKALDKLRKRTSEIEPMDAMGQWFKELPEYRGFLQQGSTKFISEYMKGFSNIALTFETSRYGFKNSAEAKAAGDRLAPAEQQVKMLQERLSYLELKKDPAETARVTAALTAAKLELLGAKKSAGTYITDSAGAYAASKSLKALEDARDGAGNLAKDYTRDYFSISEEDIKLAVRASNLLKDSSKETSEEISALFLDLKKVARSTILNPSTQYSSEIRANASIYDAYRKQANDQLAALEKRTEREKAVTKYQGMLSQISDRSGDAEIKLEEGALFNIANLGDFKISLEMVKAYNDAIATSRNSEEALFNLRAKNSEKTTAAISAQISALISAKGHTEALGEAMKLLGNTKGFETVRERLSNGASVQVLEMAAKVKKLKDNLASDTLLAGSLASKEAVATGNAIPEVAAAMAENAYRTKTIAEIKQLETQIEDALKTWMTPKEQVLLDAENLGLTLGTEVLKGLNKASGVEFARRIIDNAKPKILALRNLPADAPLQQIETAQREAGKATETANITLSPKKAKTLSELFSGSLGISFDSLRTLSKESFNAAVTLARGLEKVEEKISNLSVTASKATVDKLLKEKFDKIKAAAKIAAEYAFNSIEKISNAIDSIGFNSRNVNEGMIAFAKAYSKLNEEIATKAKEESTGLIDYAKYARDKALLEDIKTLAIDISTSDLGGVLDRINSTLGTTFSEKSFTDLGDALQSRLNNFAVYYKTAMSLIRNGSISKDAVKPLLKELEDGLKATKFLKIFEDFGKKIADTMVSSSKSKYNNVKEVFGEDAISEKAFLSGSADAKQNLSSTSLYADFFRKLIEDVETTPAGAISAIEQGIASGAPLEDIVKKLNDEFSIGLPNKSLDNTQALINLTSHIDSLKDVMVELGNIISNKPTVGALTGSDGNTTPAANIPKVIAADMRAGTAQRDNALKQIDNLLKNGRSSFIDSLDPSTGMAEKLTKLGKGSSVDRYDIARLSGSNRRKLGEKIDAVPAEKTLDNADLYDKTIKDLDSFIDTYIVSLRGLADRAGDDLRQSTQNDLAGLFKGIFSGAGGEKNAVVGVITNFAKSITDSVANSFTQSLIGKDTPLGNAIEGIGKSVMTSFTSAFSKGGGFDLGSMFKTAMTWIGGFFADGGYVSGPGSAKSDSIPAMLSNGEFVVNAAATKEYGGLLQRINDGSIAKLAEGGMITGKLDRPTASGVVLYKHGTSNKSAATFNINVTGDISRQTRREIQQMIPQIATGVNSHNYEQGIVRA